MRFWKTYFSYVRPRFSEFFILVVFFLGSSCLETLGTFYDLGISNYSTNEGRKMVEVNGYLYIANKNLNIIEQVNISTGVKVVWAGSSGVANITDGTLTNARFNAPTGIAYRSGVLPKLYVIDSGSCILREIDMTLQTVTTVAGLANNCGFNTDGIGSAGRFSGPTDIVITGTTMYVSQSFNIRKVDLTNYQVTSPVGTFGMSGGVNATGPAARFNNISGLTIANGTLFVADKDNNLIRAINTVTLAVTTLSGSGTSGFADGSSALAMFNGINSITSDGSSYLFITDYNNNAIRQIDAITGSVVTIIGDTSTNQDIDGLVASSKLSEPLGITLSTDGLFFANRNNIRRLH